MENIKKILKIIFIHIQVIIIIIEKKDLEFIIGEMDKNMQDNFKMI